MKKGGRKPPANKRKVGNEMITLGSWVTNGKGVYLVSDIDGDMVTLRDVMIDDNGVAYYGKPKLFNASEVANFKRA